MMNMMAEALDLLPHPAGIFERDGTFVAANRAGRLLAAEIVGRPWDEGIVDEALDALHLRPALHHVGVEGEHAVFEAAEGIAHISCLPTKPQLARPDLVLVTMHTGPMGDAWLAHRRMVTALEVNETSELSIQLLEATLQQVATTLTSIRDMHKSYNRRVMEQLAES